jgi:hypothetical protein
LTRQIRILGPDRHALLAVAGDAHLLHFGAAASGLASARICRTPGVQTTCETGVGGVRSMTCCLAGDPGKTPSARQMAV